MPKLKYLAFVAYILILCLALSLIYATASNVAKARFKREYRTQQGNFTAPIFESYIIPQPSFLLAAHSATFEVLNNGDLLAFWFAGSHEGKPDVKIWSSRFIHNHWSAAKSVVSPHVLSGQLAQYVRKVGNPVVYKAANGILHLFVVSVGAIGGWSGSNIEHLQSIDNGITWQNAQKLILTPLLNISTLVRTRAIALTDGGFYLPVYHEMIYKYPELLRFDANGRFIQKIRVTSKSDLLQPSVVPVTINTAYAFLRNNGNHDTNLYMQYTKDGGLSWSKPQSTNMTNQDSSIVAVWLPDEQLESQTGHAIPVDGQGMGNGKFLMVHNPLDRGRLVLSVSYDGINFKDIKVLENKPGMEYSYPSIQVHDGLIDILYTDEREKIKHVRFNKAWLDAMSFPRTRESDLLNKEVNK